MINEHRINNIFFLYSSFARCCCRWTLEEKQDCVYICVNHIDRRTKKKEKKSFSLIRLLRQRVCHSLSRPQTLFSLLFY